jgi:hypothetical protein
MADVSRLLSVTVDYASTIITQDRPEIRVKHRISFVLRLPTDRRGVRGMQATTYPSGEMHGKKIQANNANGLFA